MKRQFQKKEAATKKKLVLKVRRQKRNLQKNKRNHQKRKYTPVRTRVFPVCTKKTFLILRSTVIPPVT